MNVSFKLNAELRQSADLGKGASRRLRNKENKVPVVIYGAGGAPHSLTLDHNKVFLHLKNEAFYSQILTIAIEGKQEKVILKDVQRHPAKPRILHMDFLRISANEKLQMNIPLHLKGDTIAKGVKAGGMISRLMVDVEITCLPANLPHYIEVDITELELDQTIHLSDLKLPKGVELVALSHGDEAVVTIHLPRAAEEPVAAEPVAAAVPSSQKEAVAAPAAPAKKK